MRGSNDFTVMKGFLDDFTLKGDVTDKSEVDEVKKAEAKNEKKEKPDEGATHMSEDASYVEGASDKDIADGYVSDVQGDKVSKGWERYNDTCASGVVLKDYGFDKYNVGSVIKSMEEGIVVKEVLNASGAKKAEAKIRQQIADRNKNIEANKKLDALNAADMEARKSRIGIRSGTSFDARAPKGSPNMPLKDKLSYAIDDAGAAITSGAKKVGDYAKANPGKAALIGGGALAGAGALGYGAKKLLEKKED